MLSETNPQKAPEEASAAAAETPEERRARIIRKVIDEVRPNLQRDGGDCELISIEDKKVTVKMTGACVMCKLASMTIEGIQSRIVEELGELVRLVPITPMVPSSGFTQLSKLGAKL